MKTTIYTLCTAALLLASCANDPAEDILAGTNGTNGGDLPQGTFVIDYTASTGDAQTRIPANERIQSLDYLLYEKEKAADEDFLLKKKRSIRGIGKETRWPLTRENMTWEQREALKDTLNTNCEYKMVFVANAGKESDGDPIWDEEVLENVIVSTNTFDQGRLVLPSRLFQDNDMYYMWSNHDAPLDGSNYNKDKPASMEITLERMINKVEVKLNEEIPTDETELNEYINTRLDTYFTEMSSKDDTHTGALFTNLQEAMTTFTGKFGSTSEIGQYEENLKNYITKDESIRKLFNDINDESKHPTNALKTNFISQLNTIIAPMLQWESTNTVQVTYNKNTWASSIDFTMTSIANTEVNTDPIRYSTKGERHFIFYSFGNNTPNDNLNQIATIEFYKEGENTSAFSISGTNIPTDQVVGGNNFIILTCKPIDGIDSSSTYTYTQNNYTLKNVLQWTHDDIGYPFESGLNRLEYYINNNLSPESLNNMTLTFSVPCGIVSSWEK